MRVHILSDLHIEFGEFQLPKVDADVLVFAGDVHTKLNGIKWIKENASQDIPVIYVMGNHEFYGSKYPRLIEKIKTEAEGTNIHILENESVPINGYHFFDCTLWTDLNLFGNPMLGGIEAQRMNDYKRIRTSTTYKKLSPQDTKRIHTQALNAMKAFLETTKNEKSIIVSHHAPSIRSLPKEKQENPISVAYTSHLDEFIEEHSPALWIHGHIHESQDYRIGNTRIIANPRAYVDDPNLNFEASFVIEI
ncbi:metallophosphoesterase [Puniceicoccaceae bacterium K14]|nr:metallophosphoesterase [Puniceicoccaceae bacterium K14]